jgi:hypothetical protein
MKEQILIDPEKFKNLLKKRGFRSISHFSKACGVHRNTITEYLSLKNSPFQTTFLKITDTLRVHPLEIFLENNHQKNQELLEVLQAQLEEFITQNTSICFVLLDSSENENNGKLTITLGLTGGTATLGNAEFSIYKLKLEEFTRRRKIEVMCSNLDRSSVSFLTSLSDDIRPLYGNIDSYNYVNGVIRGIKTASALPKQ